MKLKIASWNIAGGIKHNEEKEDPNYFFEIIDDLRPDVICLQETHINNQRSLAKETFGTLYGNIVEYPVSPSHNNSKYKLGMSTLTNLKIDRQELVMLPNPNFEKTLSSGNKIFTHDKGILITEIESIIFANTQFLPMHVFNTSYDQEEELVKHIDNVILDNLSTPLIFCGDFNHKNADKLYKRSVERFGLKDALDGSQTFVYRDENPDHIYYSKDLVLNSSQVIQTKNDHFLCVAEFEY